MTDAGYRLITTHDLVRGHWYGQFEVANDTFGTLPDLEVPGSAAGSSR